MTERNCLSMLKNEPEVMTVIEVAKILRLGRNKGLLYVLCGFLITIIPIICIGPIAKVKYKMNYLTLMGMIAGSYTDPPALAYANQTAGNDAPALGYTTVYPLAMFLRIITAQLLIMFLG